MINIPKHYRKPVMIAIFIHIALLVFCIVRFVPTAFRAPQPAAPMEVIHATAIMKIPAQPPAMAQSKLSQEKNEKQKEIAQKQLEEKKQADEKKQVDEKKQTAIAAKKVLILKQEKLAKLQALEKMKKVKTQKLKKEKALALKKKQEKIAKEKAAAAKKLLAEQKKLQQAMIAQTMQSDQKSLAVAQLQQGQVDQYKAAILLLVQSNWRIDRLNDQLKCVYSIALAPDGAVLSTTLVKSSGDDNLDQSARQAIMQSSPLPVPHNPILFNHFRQLILTLSPKGFVNG